MTVRAVATPATTIRPAIGAAHGAPMMNSRRIARLCAQHKRNSTPLIHRRISSMAETLRLSEWSKATATVLLPNGKRITLKGA